MIYNNTCILTEAVEVKASYLVTPTSFQGIGQPKYSLTILFDKKSQTARDLRTAITAAITKYFKTNIPSKKNLQMPYQNTLNGFKLTARNTKQPKIVDRNNNPLPPSAISVGDIIRVYMDCYAYSFSNKQGVACRLGNIQKLKPNCNNSLGTEIASHPAMPSTFPAMPDTYSVNASLDDDDVVEEIEEDSSDDTDCDLDEDLSDDIDCELDYDLDEEDNLPL